jgi:hypothetical protein
MLVRFIETIINKSSNTETTESADVATCFCCWRHVAANGDRAVVYFMLGCRRETLVATVQFALPLDLEDCFDSPTAALKAR